MGEGDEYRSSNAKEGKNGITFNRNRTRQQQRAVMGNFDEVNRER